MMMMMIMIIKMIIRQQNIAERERMFDELRIREAKSENSPNDARPAVKKRVDKGHKDG